VSQVVETTLKWRQGAHYWKILVLCMAAKHRPNVLFYAPSRTRLCPIGFNHNGPRFGGTARVACRCAGLRLGP
jgi:hypothetical protein